MVLGSVIFLYRMSSRCVMLGAICLLTLANCAANDGGAGVSFDATSSVAYPPSHAVVDITKSPYFAKGDGITDDTAAIQRALFDTMGAHKLLYFPNGTYLISKTLTWSKENSAGNDAWGKNFLQGQNVNKTIIRLMDGTFTDVDQPASLMWCGGFGSADWFHNYIQDITFDSGRDNAGAIGLQFYSNNSGAIRNCRFIAAEESGLIGLDLGHSDMNGPLLVRNCEVIGFQRGIVTAHAVNGQTLEHITLREQREFGFDNAGQSVTIRGLLSQNPVPAIRSYGSFCILDSQLTGTENASRWPAIVNYNGGLLFARDIKTTGYGRAIGDVTSPDWLAAARITGEDKPGSLGSDISEYSSQTPTMAFPSASTSMRLPIQEPPTVPIDDPRTWANVDQFGADPTGTEDSSAAIQKAMDSGATTIFLPGSYALSKTVVVRGKVRRVVGVGGMIDYLAKVKPDFRIGDGDAPSVSFEHFSHIHGGIEVNTSRTIVFRSVSDCDLTFTKKADGGELFFEDFVTHNLRISKQRVWARQLNVENEGTHIRNDGGHLWILGYKTERGGTLLETRRGGISEVLGGFSYTTTAGKLAPMFVTDNASIYTFFREICFNNDPFEVLIQESRGQESEEAATKILKRGEAHTAPYSGHAPVSRQR